MEMEHDLLTAAITERERQKKEEGWTPQHDAQHTTGELALLACYYAMPRPIFIPNTRKSDVGNAIDMAQKKGEWILPEHIFVGTQFAPCWAKRKDKTPDKRIITAVALLMAEWDRLHQS